MDPQLPPDLVLRRDALTGGWSDGELATRLRRGDLVRLRPGAYLVDPSSPDAAARHRHLVTATLASLRRPAVVSHQSAAVLWGLPLWGAPLGRVHVSRRPPASSEVGRFLRCHVLRLPDDDVTSLDGVAVTTPARTLLDLALTLPAEPAVVALDGALRLGRVRPEDLRGLLDAVGPVPGSRRAARAIGFADGRSESVGESRSRVVLHRLALPAPELQVPVCRPDGSLIGRCDFGWDDVRTVGEFDGRVKYGRLLRPGQTAGDAVYEEKLREDDLRDAGREVVRWTWADVSTPAVIAQRLLRAFHRGRRRA